MQAAGFSPTRRAVASRAQALPALCQPFSRSLGSSALRAHEVLDRPTVTVVAHPVSSCYNPLEMAELRLWPPRCGPVVPAKQAAIPLTAALAAVKSAVAELLEVGR